MTEATKKKLHANIPAPKPTSTEEARGVVARAFPNVRSLDRRIAFLFDHGNSKFFRVNFHDPDNQNFIKRSHFVEVIEGKATEWPNPPSKPRDDFGGMFK